MLTLVCGAVTAVLLLAFLFASPSYTENEPKPVPHSLPLLGLAISFAKDRRSLYRWATAKSNNEPFSMLIAGRKHYVFHKPREYSAIFRNSKSLDTRGFLKMVFMNWFRLEKSEAERLMGELKPMLHDINTELLLRPENNEATTIKYFVELDAQMKALDDELSQRPTEALTRDAMKLVTDQQGNPSLAAYFGEQLLESSPKILTDLNIFNKEGFWAILIGMPQVLYPRPYAARDRIFTTAMKYVDAFQQQQVSASPFVAARIKALADDGLSKEGIASDVFGFIFGLLSNSSPTAYCALLNMIAQPSIISTFRTELSEAGYLDLEPSQYHTIIPNSVPRMRAFYQEGLRMHSNTVPIREVVEDTTLNIDGRTWDLQKGGVVNMANSVLHESEEFHKRPQEFIPERFLDPSLGGLGENYAKTTKVFGGGAHYCPGRVFAEKQILGFLAEMCMRFDMKITTPGYQIPRNSDFEYVLSCPVVEVEVSRRSSTS